MADENTELENQEPIDNTNQESTASAEPTYSATERKAMEQGWVPEDQWDGHSKWRSAEEFLDRGEIFSKLDDVKRRAERAERTLEDLKKHHKQVREVEYKRALAALKEEKKTALDEGDSARVVEIDDEIAETKAAAIAAQREPEVQEFTPNPAFVQWLNRNSWYNTETAMKLYADNVAQELAIAGERNPTKVLEEVERRVKKEFTHKFNNPNREKAGAVEGGGNKGKGGGRDSFTLSPEETQVMRRFVKAGVMTEKEYIAEIKAQREGA